MYRVYFDLKNKMAQIAQKLLLLQPKSIDTSKCTQDKSVYWQIIWNNQTALDRQAKQFNLGNTHKFTDPIKAAHHLLQRANGNLPYRDHGLQKPVRRGYLSPDT